VRLLTDEERCALRTIGPPGQGPGSPATFDHLVSLGYGRWVVGSSFFDRVFRRTYWEVTAAGTAALERDTLTRASPVGPVGPVWPADPVGHVSRGLDILGF